MAFKITNAANDTPVLWLYGEIGVDFNADEVRQAMQTIPGRKTIETRIHSEGGSYVDAIAIHTIFGRHQGHKKMIVDGLAASGGSVIAMAGDEIEMAEGSWMMIHEARGGIRDATAREFREYADRIEATNSELVKIYTRRWKGDEKALRTALDAETWLTSGDAIKAGLADSVSSQLALAACADLSKFGYTNTPKAILEAKTRLPGLIAMESVVNELFSEPAA